VKISGRPILWHILKTYGSFSSSEFVICCGYKGYVLKEYFANYFLHMSDVTFHVRTNSMEVHQKNAEPCEVNLVDTGEATPYGRPSPCSAWRLRGNCRPTDTTATGSRWTPCGIGCISRSCG